MDTFCVQRAEFNAMGDTSSMRYNPCSHGALSQRSSTTHIHKYNIRQNLSVRETQAVMRAQKRVGLEGTSTKKDLPDDAAFELGLESRVGYDRGKRMHKNNSNF